MLRQQNCYRLEVKVGQSAVSNTHTDSALKALVTKPHDLSRSLEPRRDQIPVSCPLTSHELCGTRVPTRMHTQVSRYYKH